jgi:hypothetical protein
LIDVFSHCDRVSSSSSRRRIAGYTVPLGILVIPLMLKPWKNPASGA